MKGIKMRKKQYMSVLVLCLLILVTSSGIAQIQNRVGTTAANFLEVGVGTAGSAMGDAYVSNVSDITAIYWNPAGLAFMEKNEAQFMQQPWIADISSSFVAAGVILPGIGTLALSINHMAYGEMDVTNLEFPDGNGETFSPGDYAVSAAFSRKLVQWFSFGLAVKYINSQIWHSSASAFALDLGVIVNTDFFTPTGEREDGMKIGMSISNYGGKMRYDGLDLMNPIDISSSSQGNYADASGRLYLTAWELPLIFRVGMSLNAIKTSNHRVTLAVDALHPNNNSESVNVGGEYAMLIPAFGEVFLRGGYKALFMDKSEYGPTFGAGLTWHVTRTNDLKLGYAFKTMGVLGNTSCYSIAMTF